MSSTTPEEGVGLVGWQSMDTAPNNVVLVTNGSYVTFAVPVEGRWFTGWESDGITVRLEVHPTHWMHLPKPPATQPKANPDV